MRIATKILNIMGNTCPYGGVALDTDNILYAVVNGANKLVAVDLTDSRPGPDCIRYSMNAFGYDTFCEVRSITVLDHSAYNKSVLMLLKNGEIWRKDLTDNSETKWEDPAWAFPYPQCRGASGIEYHDGALYVTFPQANAVKKLSLQTLQVVAEYPLGVTADSPYPPAAISFDGVNDRWVTVDPVKGDIVYGNALDFQEAGRERYTYNIYNRCFDGDIAWSKSALPSMAGHDFFVLCSENRIILFTEPWYKLYEVDDFTGVYTEVDGILFDNTEIGENVRKHLRLENMTDRLREGLTISLTDNPATTVDDYLHLSLASTGPWEKLIEAGDLSGHGVIDFYMRFYPQTGVDLGTFTVDLLLDWQST